MSITPMPTASTAAPATPTGEAGAADGPVDGTFAALVSSLLGEGQPSPAGTGAAEAVVVPPVVAEEQTVEPAAAEGTPAPGDEQFVAPVVTPFWAPLATPLVPTPVTVPSSDPSADESADSVDAGTAIAEGAVAGDPLAAAGATTQATSTTATPVDVAAAGRPAVPGSEQGTTVEGAATSTAGATTDPAAPASADTSQRESGDQPPAAPAPARASENEPAPAPAPAPTGVAPTAAASAPAATGTSGTDAARPVPVVSQLAPEVTRMVSRGNGLHHVTMLLQPEALGEVRVTLTVRNGEVLVRLAAGDDAQRALLEGAPELRRVLELAGASDARVVVRDLPSAAPGSQQGWQSPERSAHDSSGAFGGGGDTNASGERRTDDQDQHARTRGGSTARDGLTDGAHQLRPNPVTDASRGIDLTM